MTVGEDLSETSEFPSGWPENTLPFKGVKSRRSEPQVLTAFNAQRAGGHGWGWGCFVVDHGTQNPGSDEPSPPAAADGEGVATRTTR